MALTKTAVSNPAFLAKARRALREAGRLALQFPYAKTATAFIRNRRGEVTAKVTYHLAPAIGVPAFEIIDSQDRDVTGLIRDALKVTQAA